MLNVQEATCTIFLTLFYVIICITDMFEMHTYTLSFYFFRLKAIKKQMGHVVAENDEERAALSDLNKDLLRRNEQVAQVIL